MSTNAFAKQPCWEDIEVGREFSGLTKKPTTKTIVMWAGAVDAYGEMHFDKDVALKDGFKGVILHGDMLGAYLMELLTDNTGSEGYISSISYRHTGANYPDMTYTCRAKPLSKHVADGKAYVDLDVWIENESAEKKTVGKATICLPQRGSGPQA
ncbi:MAG: MaoC/PaaZ C-terminal domain-containing protein [Dehalococcoidia bacterium]|nr:MaoC/PaaZ C-terminal domain-containing protein [Dehalococcoidia bacterium]